MWSGQNEMRGDKVVDRKATQIKSILFIHLLTIVALILGKSGLDCK